MKCRGVVGMRAYRSAWLTVCGISGAFGIAFAVFICSPSVIFMLCLAAVGVATLAVKVSPPRDGQVLRHIGRTMAVSVPALLGACGLIAGFAELGWLWLACLAVAGAPVLVHHALTREPSAKPPVGTVEKLEKPVGKPKAKPPQPQPPAKQVHTRVHSGTSTAAICWTWRRSYVALQKADRDDDRLRLVLLRQQCLDELAVREPIGFHTWLTGGARAASDPTRYVCRRSKKGKASH